MKPYKYTTALAAMIVWIALILTLTTCDKDSNHSPSGPDGLNGGTYDPILNADGGFVITYGMLDKRYNEITFPGTHNSFTYHAGVEARNQGLSITKQLEYGIRYIEFDLDENLMARHGVYRAEFNPRLVEIKDYAKAHPRQVITVRISDLTSLSATDSYHRVNGRLEDTGLDEYIYNWDFSKPKDNPGRCYIPDPWPTLREMINSGKNVMFLHHRDYGDHGIIDEGLCSGLSYDDTRAYVFYAATKQEQFCRLMPMWQPPYGRQVDGAYRLFLIECEPDNGAPGGHEEHAAKNNDGRKLYQVAKQHEVEILPDNREVNFIIVDYFMSSNAYQLPIDVVDACNRLNYERFGSDWEHSECFWELYPYEFDDSRVEYIRQISAIKAEVAQVVDDFRSKRNLDGHEDRGQIRSTTYHTEYDWKRIPEWAVDNDMFTRWCGSSSNDDHTWGIDLGESRSIDEIAIAWEFTHKRPAYLVYSSNDDSRFADGISNEELLNNGGWTIVAQGAMQTNVYGNLWDMPAFDGGSVTSWRYFKIKVTDADSEHWPSFWEVRLYGPAN